MGLKGIDVSQHQGTIDWNKVKNQISFAILRLGWIGNNVNHTLDTQFERNYAECKRLGIPVGVYIYNYCASVETIRNGADWVVLKLKGKKLDLPVYIDMEDDSISRQGKDRLTEMVFEFNKIIEKKGYWAGVYANKNWYDNYLHGANIKKRFTTWIAHYGVNEDKYAGQYDILQYTSSGKVNGIDSNRDGYNDNVDMNVMYRDLLTEIKGTKQNVPQTTNTPNTTTATSLKYKVGDKVKVSSYYASSTDPDEKAVRRNAEGTITKVLTNGAKNPYLLNNGDLGWCNDGDIRGKVEVTSYYPKCDKSHTSLVDALKSIGVDSSIEYRTKIAQKNYIKDYTGKDYENKKLLEKLKAGRLIKI